jgi:hypothetical protein
MADDETQDEADEVLDDLDAEDDADKVTGGVMGDPDEGGQIYRK